MASRTRLSGLPGVKRQRIGRSARQVGVGQPGDHPTEEQNNCEAPPPGDTGRRWAESSDPTGAEKGLCRRLTLSAKLAGPHPINPLSDHDLGMLAIANIAAESTCAALPTHRLAGMPSRAYRGWPRSRAQLVALACLPGLASG
jgi:hypothetical protein